MRGSHRHACAAVFVLLLGGVSAGGTPAVAALASATPADTVQSAPVEFDSLALASPPARDTLRTFAPADTLRTFTPAGDTLRTFAPADTLRTFTPADTPGLPPVPSAIDSAATPRPDPLALRGTGRPNPFTAATRALGAMVADGLHLYTAPLRMDARNLLVTAGVVAVGAGMYAYDEDVYRGFTRSREDPVYEAVVIRAGEFFEPTGRIAATTPWLQGAAVLGWLLDVPLLRTVPVEILESNFLVATARQPIERTSGRPRPYGGAPRSEWRKGGDSFPSGHASVQCEAAAILSHHFRHPAARAAIWGATLTALLQRVDEPGHNHWPTDVWFGAALGTWAGHTIAVRNEERRQGVEQGRWWDVLRRPERGVSVVPTVGPGHVGLRVRVGPW